MLRRKRDDESKATTPEPRPGDAPRGRDSGSTFIPARSGRRGLESLLVRIIATGGVVGIGTAIAAIMGSQDVASWIIGLVVSGVVVVLAAVLWSSRTM